MPVRLGVKAFRQPRREGRFAAKFFQRADCFLRRNFYSSFAKERIF
jgi:hypothetical protein